MTMTYKLCDGLVAPHAGRVIEPGAILYSSWGYDQTNIDFYYVTRTTRASCWTVPMSNRITEVTGFMSEHVVAGEPQWFTSWCECRHRVSNHGTVLNMAGDDYTHCRGAYGEDCDCREVRPEPIKPTMHRIRRDTWAGEVHESIHLTSYSSAWPWAGSELYASHYA